MVYGSVSNQEYGLIYNEYPEDHAYAAHRNGKITRQGRSDCFDHPKGFYSTRISSKTTSDGFVSGNQLRAAASQFNMMVDELSSMGLLKLTDGLSHHPESVLRVVQEGYMGRMVRVELNMDSLGDGLNSNLALFSLHLQKGTIFNIKFNNDDYFKSLLEQQFDMKDFKSQVWREGFPVQEFMECFNKMFKHFCEAAGTDLNLFKKYLTLLMIQNSKQDAELITSGQRGNTYVRMVGCLNDWLPYLQNGVKPLYVARCFHKLNVTLDENGVLVAPANTVDELKELGGLPLIWYQKLI